MKRLLGISAAVITLGLMQTAIAQPAEAQDQPQQATGSPIQTLKAERQAAEARDRARLSALVEDREALSARLAEVSSQLEEARAHRQRLDVREGELDARREALAEKRQQAGGEMEAIAGTLESQTNALRDDLADSFLTAGEVSLPPRMGSDALPRLEHLEALADSLMSLTVASGQVQRLTAPVADAGGERERREVIRVGDILALSEGQLLRRPGPDGQLSMSGHTPRAASETLKNFQAGREDRVVIDPSQGQVMEVLAQQPSLLERFHQGGAVGYVVVTLGVLGLLAALAQYAYLIRVSLAVRRQLGDLNHPGNNNPLGRVIRRLASLSRDHAAEALEARLDEALLAEQPRLERGQPLVKLLAAVAPLLGLLGTVTGMIGTFQAITVFGTGDPQMMAGGISQALVTTVLGLITAVPLLFAHTALASRSRHLVGVIEGRASAALAERLEPLTADDERERHASLA
ncbi:MotA/TolQ/ExbB proton channel family protein [Onishia niordana]|uniref:MotA/TolQ/ExbB proton channel family protein n=1 Tax=Onishia niordana TaxID=2508711 RepID=UPI001F0D0F2C|nr:MotA/TolQ/ExbB proton channel family protein [Halomonas niordiana]